MDFLMDICNAVLFWAGGFAIAWAYQRDKYEGRAKKVQEGQKCELSD